MTKGGQTMHRKPIIALAALVLLAVLALIGTVVYLPHASASRPVHSPGTAAKVVTVAIRQFSFEPETLIVHAGDTVEWKNEDIVPHTVTEDSLRSGFDSNVLLTDAVWHYVPRNKGTYKYTCTLHPNMKGKLIVQ
jgi:plastocyanin